MPIATIFPRQSRGCVDNLTEVLAEKTVNQFGVTAGRKTPLWIISAISRFRRANRVACSCATSLVRGLCRGDADCLCIGDNPACSVPAL